MKHRLFFHKLLCLQTQLQGSFLPLHSPSAVHIIYYHMTRKALRALSLQNQ